MLLISGEMADNVGKGARITYEEFAYLSCERERERAGMHGVDKFGRHSPVGTRSPESVSVRGLLAPKSHPRSHFRSGLRLRAKSCSREAVHCPGPGGRVR